MRIASVALALVLVLLCSGGGGRVADSSAEDTEEKHSEVVTPQSGFSFGWFPSKGEFVTWENEPFLIAVVVDCVSGNTSRANVELLEPTPSFVQLRPLCFSGTPLGGLALVAIAPGEGDAGKHRVRISATPCDINGVGGIIDLSVKVKKAR